MNTDIFVPLTELSKNFMVPVQKLGSITVANAEKMIQFQTASLEEGGAGHAVAKGESLGMKHGVLLVRSIPQTPYHRSMFCATVCKCLDSLPYHPRG